MDDEIKLPDRPYYYDEDAVEYHIYFKDTEMWAISKVISIEELIFNLNAAYLMGWLRV